MNAQNTPEAWHDITEDHRGTLNAASVRQKRDLRLRPWHQCAVFLFACLVLVSRRPDAILHAQFWAEDGRVYFQDAYNLGWWAALFRPDGGCFHEFPRLGSSLALLVPLSFAPLVQNLIAIAAQALPVNLLLSCRSSVWGSLRYRVLMASIYLALPNSWEVSGNIANSQCLLALSAFLVLIAHAPRGVGGRLFDISIVLLSGLTGPYCIFLFPIALFLARRRRVHRDWILTYVVAATSVLQLSWLLLGHPGRPHYFMGANVEWFTRILATQVYLGALIGGNGLGAYPSSHFFVFLVSTAIGGTTVVGICFIKSSMEMRLFLLFSTIVLAASLYSPLIPPRAGLSIWQLMARGGGIHYWFFPTLGFTWCLLCCFNRKPVLLKIIAGYLLFFMCVAIVRDWRHPAFRDMQFAAYVGQFDAASAGTIVEIPVNPDGSSIRLLKH